LNPEAQDDDNLTNSILEAGGRKQSTAMVKGETMQGKKGNEQW